jgi:hypothetical protein
VCDTDMAYNIHFWIFRDGTGDSLVLTSSTASARLGVLGVDGRTMVYH